MGYTKDGDRTPGEFSYRATPNSADAPVPQDRTAGGENATDHSAVFGCMCQSCGAMVEAIFQPVGRAVCAEVGFPLPCQAEFDACQAATPAGRPDGYTGTATDLNLIYPPLNPFQDEGGNWLSQSDPCQPEATFGAYKAAYNLSSQCAAGATALADGGTAEALALATCVATSRIGVYASASVPCAEVDIGGPSCGDAFPAESCVQGAELGGLPGLGVSPEQTQSFLDLLAGLGISQAEGDGDAVCVTELIACTGDETCQTLMPSDGDDATAEQLASCRANALCAAFIACTLSQDGDPCQEEQAACFADATCFAIRSAIGDEPCVGPCTAQRTQIESCEANQVCAATLRCDPDHWLFTAPTKSSALLVAPTSFLGLLVVLALGPAQ
eukprot:SAG31_NODE_720_length_12587_cov_15.393114_3_plen_385_part_00